MSSTPEPISKKELFLRACRGEALPRAPVWMMRQAGGYLPQDRELRAKDAFLEGCKTPEVGGGGFLQPFWRVGGGRDFLFSGRFFLGGGWGGGPGVWGW